MSRDRASSVLNLSVDQVSFLPVKMPTEILKMVPISSKLPRNLFRKILQVVIKDIEGTAITEEQFEHFRGLLNNVPDEKFAWLYAGVLSLMRYALRYPLNVLKKENVANELKDIRLNDEFIEDICSIVFSNKSHETRSGKSPLNLPSLVSFRWRVDVDISNSILNRVLKPTILMQMKNSEGKTTTFERLKWYGHVSRMADGSLVKTVFNADFPNKRKRGRPPKRWTDQIVEDTCLPLNALETMAQDRDVWRRNINAMWAMSQDAQQSKVYKFKNTTLIKKMFAAPTMRYYRDPWLKIADILGVPKEQAKKLTQSKHEFTKLVLQRTSLPLPL